MSAAGREPYHHQPPRPDEPLRVLMLASLFPKPGNERMGVWALAPARALRRRGVELTVVSFTSWLPRAACVLGGTVRVWAGCPKEHRWPAVQGGDDVRTVYPRWLVYQKGALWRWCHRNPGPAGAIAWRSARRALLRMVDELRPHVIYAHYTLPNGDLARRVKALRGIPYVLVDHSRGEIDDCEHMPGRRAVFGAVLRESACWTGVSSVMLSSLERLFPGTRAEVIPNGADPIPEELLSRPRPPELEGKTVVLSAGGFFPIKGFPNLVRAFARVADKHPDAVLRIVGDGEYRPQVEEAIRETGLGNRVQLVGALPHRELLQEMVWSDVFALLSWNEAFGVVFVEASAAGKPIVWTTDVGAADVLRDGVHGRCVPPRDEAAAAAALDALLGNPHARREMGEACRSNFLSRLTWDACAARTETVLRRAATGAG